MSTDAIDTAARIETPEHIAFEFRIAGPWRRMWSYVIDLVLRIVLMFVLVLVLSLTVLVFDDVGELAQTHTALMLLIYFAIEWFYYVLFEWLWNGTTPGKRALGLRVVKEGGYPVGLQDTLLRNLLRPADAMPPLVGAFLPTYLVGALVSAADTRFRRLGDLVANTIVIAEEPVRLWQPAPVEPPPAPGELAQIPPHPRLSVEEKKTLDAFLRRFRTIHPARREELCEQYARTLAHRLGAPPPKSGARFLQLVYARLAEQAKPLRGGRAR